MSSDTDEDLSPERYDPEDNLNFYGSPIFEPNDAPRPSIAVSRRTEVSIYTFCHHQFILTNNSPRILVCKFIMNLIKIIILLYKTSFAPARIHVVAVVVVKSVDVPVVMRV